MTDPAGSQDTMRDTPRSEMRDFPQYEEDFVFFERLIDAIPEASSEDAERLKAQMAHGMVNVLVRELRRIATALEDLVEQGRG